jgi:hypothetical protein
MLKSALFDFLLFTQQASHAPQPSEDHSAV